MSESPPAKSPVKQSAWLGIAVGWLSQLGLKTLLPVIALVGIRSWSSLTQNPAMWLEHADDSSHPGWYVLQASVFAGSAVAGALAAMLSPRRAFVVPAALVMLSLLATFFEQFPRPLSVAVALVWAGGPCVGLVGGWLLARWRMTPR